MPNVIPVKVNLIGKREYEFTSKSGEQIKGDMYYGITEEGKIEFSTPPNSQFPLTKDRKFNPDTATLVHLVCTGFNYTTNQLKYRTAREDEILAE